MLRNILAILIIAFLVAVGSCSLTNLLAQEAQSIAEAPRYWYCYQYGVKEKEVFFVRSNIFTDSKENHYEERDQTFDKFVKDVIGPEYKSLHTATCLDYDTMKRAQKHLQRKLTKAKREGLQTVQIEFSF